MAADRFGDPRQAAFDDGGEGLPPVGVDLQGRLLLLRAAVGVAVVEVPPQGFVHLLVEDRWLFLTRHDLRVTNVDGSTTVSTTFVDGTDTGKTLLALAELVKVMDGREDGVWSPTDHVLVVVDNATAGIAEDPLIADLAAIVSREGRRRGVAVNLRLDVEAAA